MKRFAILALVLLVASALMVGCGTSQKKTVKAESKEGKIEITTGADKTITEAELGVPVYPGAKSNFAGKYDGKQPGQGNVSQHILVTPDGFDKVVKFYKSNLKNVKSGNTISTGDSRMAVFHVGEGKSQMMVHIMGNPKENNTMIQVIKG